MSSTPSPASVNHPDNDPIPPCIYCGSDQHWSQSCAAVSSIQWVVARLAGFAVLTIHQPDGHLHGTPVYVNPALVRHVRLASDKQHAKVTFHGAGSFPDQYEVMETPAQVMDRFADARS